MKIAQGMDQVRLLWYSAVTAFSALRTSPTTARPSLTLKDWEERESSERLVLDGKGAYGQNGRYRKDRCLAFNPPAIIGMSTTGGIEELYPEQAVGLSRRDGEGACKFIAAADARKEISGVTTTFSTKVPQYYANVDRIRAKALGVDLNNLFATMGSVFRNYYVNDFDEADVRSRCSSARKPSTGTGPRISDTLMSAQIREL